ncbi:proline dehydrogenase [Mycobacterium sp. GA-1841]|uniref:proline dehydrogenase family protein n=1 Tax=Mycobacterium sp. GA-1841 TaxID=1834154 RepID=UPI00096E0D1B|nr:proline dehydrogenase family protein [Mycobacterium sp. GA-1841]OMC32956.1 proline dehydrogenase [Mycobacterium sp. GA-1841]
MARTRGAIEASFQRVARPVILAASRSPRLRQTAERLPITRKVVDRFVAGETIPDALYTVGALRNSGRLVSVDYLGEDTTSSEDAERTVQAYLALLDGLAQRDEARSAARPLEVSLKLSALGQALPRDGEKIAYENAHTICTKAREAGAWVTVDAEDHTTTDSTLSIVRDLRTEFDWLGTVLQAYLHRTEDDCREFAASGARIRLCKGAYDEPASVAYRDAGEVTDSYLRCLQVLMAGSGYPMVASHDPVIIEAVPELAAEFGRDVDRFEYQMLYNIRDGEQRRLADAGNHVRVYIPFGYEWYGYFVRRLAERPANLMFFLRALAERR